MPGENVRKSSTTTNQCTIEGNPCQQQLDAGINNNSQKIDDQNLNFQEIANLLNTGGQAVDLAVLHRIDNKLGAQVPGGISGFLGRMSNRFKLPEIINVIAMIATLHNAAMLSKNLAVTLGDIVSLGLNIVGLKDEDDKPHNVNEIIGKSVNGLMEDLLGTEVWRDTKDTWKRANRMYQTAANIVYSVGSMVDSARTISEWTGENLGKIGNALKSAGVVAENAYRWMPEQINAASSRMRNLQKMRDGINSLDSSVSAFGSVVSEVKSIQDEVKEMGDKKKSFEKDLKELVPKEDEDNEPVKKRQEQEEQENKVPDYNQEDLRKAN